MFAQYLNTGPAESSLNMALDELLLDQAAGGVAALRLYSWSDAPCVSLGYFQSSAELQRPGPFGEIRFVRRITGGGAIIHHHDITYALAVPAAWKRSPRTLVKRFHCGIARALARHGVAATIGTMRQQGPETDFLCFRRSDQLAVCVHSHKICGSAQRRRHDAVLIHGSLLARASSLAPNVPGIEELTGRLLDSEQLACIIANAAAAALQIELRPSQLKQSLAETAQRLARDKYQAAGWNHRR